MGQDVKEINEEELDRMMSEVINHQQYFLRKVKNKAKEVLCTGNLVFQGRSIIY